MIALKCLAELITVIFIVEEKPNRRGRTRRWIKQRDMKDYFNNIIKELSLENSSEYHKMM